MAGFLRDLGDLGAHQLNRRRDALVQFSPRSSADAWQLSLTRGFIDD